MTRCVRSGSVAVGSIHRDTASAQALRRAGRCADLHAGAGWRLVSLINVPICIVMILLFSMWIIEIRAPVPALLDIKGAIILASGLPFSPSVQ